MNEEVDGNDRTREPWCELATLVIRKGTESLEKLKRALNDEGGI